MARPLISALRRRAFRVAAFALPMAFAACGDPGSDAPRSDIRDGDVDSLIVAATFYLTFPGGYSLDHNYQLIVDCPSDPSALDDRGDSGTVSQVDVNQGHGDFDLWFVGRAACRSAGALLTAAKAELAGAGYADSTQDFTRLRYRVRGGAFDSLRVPKDAIRDSASYPRLTRLIRDLQAAVDP